MVAFVFYACMPRLTTVKYHSPRVKGIMSDKEAEQEEMEEEAHDVEDQNQEEEEEKTQEDDADS